MCGYCGKRLITHIRVMGGGRKRSALACLARVHGPDRAHPKGQDGRDVNRVVIDHDRLESYVFETVVAALSGDSRLSDKLSERGPDVDAQITELERQRDAVVEKQRRLNDLYLDGDVDRDYHRDTVASLKAEHAALQNQINDLLGKPLLSAAMSDGLDWKKWTADKRRSFLKAAGVTVRVFAWPEGMARNLGRRRDETAAQHAERVDAHQRAVIEKRVEIVV